MTLSKSQIIEIESLKDSMKLTELAKKLEVNISTIYYHLNKDKRKEQMKRSWKKKTLDERRIIYKKRLPYLKEYRRKRYKSDESFRHKEKERSKKYKSKPEKQATKGRSQWIKKHNYLLIKKTRYL